MIIIKENIDNVDEYNYLYDEVGWGSYSNEISKKALSNNIYSVSIYDNEDIIGYGRIIGDGIVFLYIHDIMVKTAYQNQGIGKLIMQNILEKIKSIKIDNPDLRVYLGASLGKESFYKKYGFITREEAGLGAGMILNIGEII